MSNITAFPNKKSVFTEIMTDNLSAIWDAARRMARENLEIIWPELYLDPALDAELAESLFAEVLLSSCVNQFNEDHVERESEILRMRAVLKQKIAAILVAEPSS